MTASQKEFSDEDVALFRAVDSPAGTGQDYALVIGVNDYPKLRPLQGAIADAKAFARWLIDRSGGGLRSHNVHTVFSSADPLTPIGPEINDALEEILVQAQLTGGRRFYFYFSGHGCVGDKASDLALCMANWSSLRRRAALSSDAWLDVVVRSGLFDEVAFFMDCCRVWATRAVGLPPHIDFAHPVERSRGTRVFLAYATELQRSAMEVSSSDDQPEVRGIFTEVLLDGLRGAAMDDQSGIVTAWSLKYHIEKKTRDLARSHGYHQRAEVIDGLEEGARFGEAHDVFAPVRPSDSAIDAAQAISATAEGAEEWVRSSDSAIDAAEQVFDELLRESAYIKRPTSKQRLDEPQSPPPPNSSAPRERRRFTGAAYEPIRSTPFRDQPTRPSFHAWLPVNHPRYQYRGSNFNSRTQSLKQGEALLSIVFIGSNGLGWSLRREYEYSKFALEPQTSELGEEWIQFSECMKPGAYYLCCSDAAGREIAIHLFSGWTTQVVIEHAMAPHYESIRVFLRYGRDRLPPSESLAHSTERCLALLGATTLEEVPIFLENIMRGPPAAFNNPMLGLFAAHLYAREKAPAAGRINAAADWIEELIGPCADIEALRLRAALIQGGEIPRKTFTEPPMLREGLLAFIEASHLEPNIIAPQSLLEYACIERQMDCPLSSWPARSSPETPDSEWLAAAVDEIVAECQLRNAPLDARVIAKELGVPTLAVEAKLPKSNNMSTPIVEMRRKSAWRKMTDFQPVDELEVYSDPEQRHPLQTSDLLLDIREHYEAGEYRTALRLAEAILREHPDHLAALGYAESSRQMLRQKYLSRIGDMTSVPRIKLVAIELARVGVQPSDLQIVDAIDGVRTIEQIIDFSGCSALDVLRVIHDLALDGLLELVAASRPNP